MHHDGDDIIHLLEKGLKAFVSNTSIAFFKPFNKVLLSLTELKKQGCITGESNALFVLSVTYPLLSGWRRIAKMEKPLLCG